MNEAQAASAKAGQERFAKVRWMISSTNMGLKAACTGARKPPAASELPCGPPPVVMKLSSPLMRTIQIQINAPIVKPSRAWRRF